MYKSLGAVVLLISHGKQEDFIICQWAMNPALISTVLLGCAVLKHGYYGVNWIQAQLNTKTFSESVVISNVKYNT